MESDIELVVNDGSPAVARSDSEVPGPSWPTEVSDDADGLGMAGEVSGTELLVVALCLVSAGDAGASRRCTSGDRVLGEYLRIAAASLRAAAASRATLVSGEVAGDGEWVVREGEGDCGAGAELTSMRGAAGESTAAEDGGGAKGDGGVCWPVTGTWGKLERTAEGGDGNTSLAAATAGVLGAALALPCTGEVARWGCPGVGATMRCTVWTLLSSAWNGGA